MPKSDVRHGARKLARVVVATYNSDFRTRKGFVGSRVSIPAFRALLDAARRQLRDIGSERFGTIATQNFSKKQLDRLLFDGHPEAAGVIHGTIEQFAHELADIVIHFRQAAPWRRVGQIVVGGGLRDSRIGELVIGRASVLIQHAGHRVQLRPTHHHPDEAGLLGAIHLVPAGWLTKYDAVLTLDIGGSNIRAGLVELQHGPGAEVHPGALCAADRWRYADERPRPGRDIVMQRMGATLSRLARRADKARVRLAPIVAVACPGVIADDGAIVRGGLNLPGDWQSERFSLPARIATQLPRLGGRRTRVVVHNDAVAHGLSELERTQDARHWAVLTIGTGLGSAVFTNRRDRE